jgi:hypothetical protein
MRTLHLLNINVAPIVQGTCRQHVAIMDVIRLLTTGRSCPQTTKARISGSATGTAGIDPKRSYSQFPLNVCTARRVRSQSALGCRESRSDIQLQSRKTRAALIRIRRTCAQASGTTVQRLEPTQESNLVQSTPSNLLQCLDIDDRDD